MGLTKEQIKLLLNKPKKKRGTKAIDHSVRDIATWFKMTPAIYGDENEPGVSNILCSNPNCTDDRPPRKTSTGKLVKSQFLVEINGQLMCRRCFMGGYLLKDHAQEQLEV